MVREHHPLHNGAVFRGNDTMYRPNRLLSVLLLLVPGLFLLAAVLLYTQRAPALQTLANALLRPHGVSVARPEAVRLGIHASHIGSIRIEGPGNTIHHLEDIHIEYRPGGLLSGRIDELRVAVATLQWPQGDPSEAPARIPELPSDLAKVLPFETLIIEQLRIDAVPELSARLELRSDGQTLDLRLLTPDPWQLTLPLPDDAELLASSHNAGLGASYDPASTRLTLRPLTEEEPLLLLHSDWLQTAMGIELHGAQARLKLEQLHCDLRPEPLCNMELSSSLQINRMGSESVEMRDISTEPRFTARLLPGHIELAVAADSELRIAEAMLPGNVHIERPELQLPATAMARLHYSDGQFTDMELQAASLLLKLPAIRHEDSMGGMELALEDIDARLGSNNRASANLIMRQPYTNLFPLNLWDLVLRQRLDWRDQTLHLDGTARLGSQNVLHLQLQQNLVDLSGTAQIHVPDISFSEERRLSDLIQPLPVDDVDLLNGQLQGSASLEWQLQNGQISVVGPVTAQLSALSGYFQNIGFLHASTQFRGRLDPGGALRSDAYQPLYVGNLDPGVAMENVRLEYALDTEAPRLALRNAELELLGGQLQLDSFEYRGDAESNQGTLELHAIDLEQVLALGAYPAVNASGRISGNIPFQLSNRTVTVSDGRLSAGPEGGHIRYQGTAGQGGRNGQLDLVYDALSEYRYSMLEADVAYAEDGELDLAVRLEGISPNVNQGQRINLNLNINDNIPALLESLQATRSIMDRIEQEFGGRR